MERVKLDLVAAVAGPPLTAGRAGQGQAEGLAVAAPPLGHDVGDHTAIVFGGEDHVAAGGAGDVEPVHPGVAVKTESTR